MTLKCGVSLGLDENTHDGSYATLIDAAEAIDSLSNADHKKLVLIARYFWNLRKLGTDWGEPEDLLFEAVLRTLEGERRWRHSTVSMVRHLDRVMESISGHWVKRREVYGQALMTYTLSEIMSAITPSVEDRLNAREQLDAIETLFEDDMDALELLRCKAEERTASEIRSKLGMSSREYETISRRIRRKLIRFSEKLELENGR